MGLTFRHVPDGVFDSGGTGTNAAEAKLVAQEVIRHAKTNPGHSLGVATFSMRFGPLGADGGERRLNVLISCAKRRCEVFSSITDEDIDLERARGRASSR
jgi:hypothetical protein